MTPRPEISAANEENKVRLTPAANEGSALLAGQQEVRKEPARRQDYSSVRLEPNGFTLTNASNETLSITRSSAQAGRSAVINQFRLSEHGRVVTGALHEGGWLVQSPDDRWQNLQNVRLSDDRQSVAFESKDLKTAYWQLDGRKYTTDGKLAPIYFTGADGRMTSAPAVTEATDHNGTTTEFHYNQIDSGGSSYSQLKSYTIRDSAGQIKEFAVRNVDGPGKAHWITFKPTDKEKGLLANMSAKGQAETLQSVEDIATNDGSDRNRAAKSAQGLPPELSGRAVSDPYQQVASEAVDSKGHLYKTLYNGATITQGDDDRNYLRTADGMLNATETDNGGNSRLLLHQSRKQDRVVTDRFAYDDGGRIAAAMEEVTDSEGKTLSVKSYQLQNGQWQTTDSRDPQSWVPANVHIQNYPDGRVAFETLNKAGQGGTDSDAVRILFPTGGETDLERLGNGRLGVKRIVSATGDDTSFWHGPGGDLTGAEQLSPGSSKSDFQRATYQPGTNGRWQRVIHDRSGDKTEDLGRLLSLDEGGMDFENARLDQRGDLMYTQTGHRLLPDARPPLPQNYPGTRGLIEANLTGEAGLRAPQWVQALADTAPDSEVGHAVNSLANKPTLYRSSAAVAYTPQFIREAKELNYYTKKERQFGDGPSKSFWA